MRNFLKAFLIESTDGLSSKPSSIRAQLKAIAAQARMLQRTLMR